MAQNMAGRTGLATGLSRIAKLGTTVAARGGRMTPEEPIIIETEIRDFVRLAAVTPLARPLLTAPGERRLGPRLERKARRLLFDFAHLTLRLPATGWLTLEGPGERRQRLAVDLRDSAYLNFERRRRQGGYDAVTQALVEWAAPQARTVFDIGANWGLFTLQLLTHPGFQGQVHAFEIEAAARGRLAKLLKAAGFDDRAVIPDFGLSDRDGDIAIAIGRHSYLVHVTSQAPGNSKVPVRRLDGAGLPAPDLIKLDVEGHEAAVIEGAWDTLQASRPALVFESRRSDPDAARALTLLQTLGYRLLLPRAESAAGVKLRLRLQPLTPAQKSNLEPEVNLFALHPDGPIRLNRPRFGSA
jgi:FkbM family methyltransferase